MKTENKVIKMNRNVDIVISETKEKLESVLNGSHLAPSIMEIILENALYQVRMLKMISTSMVVDEAGEEKEHGEHKHVP